MPAAHSVPAVAVGLLLPPLPLQMLLSCPAAAAAAVLAVS